MIKILDYKFLNKKHKYLVSLIILIFFSLIFQISINKENVSPVITKFSANITEATNTDLCSRQFFAFSRNAARNIDNKKKSKKPNR